MYCVKCGVRLGDGVRQCPLCQTPVWCPDETVKADTAFSSAYPAPPRSARYPVLAFLTVICAAACLTTLILCLKTYGRVAWSGYVMLGLAVFYFSFCFPAWFDRPHPMVFLPLFLISAYRSSSPLITVLGSLAFTQPSPLRRYASFEIYLKFSPRVRDLSFLQS